MPLANMLYLISNRPTKQQQRVNNSAQKPSPGLRSDAWLGCTGSAQVIVVVGEAPEPEAQDRAGAAAVTGNIAMDCPAIWKQLQRAGRGALRAVACVQPEEIGHTMCTCGSSRHRLAGHPGTPAPRHMPGTPYPQTLDKAPRSPSPQISIPLFLTHEIHDLSRHPLVREQRVGLCGADPLAVALQAHASMERRGHTVFSCVTVS